jgi:5-(carboxyamino)imidazole ribonucleotide synthase
MKTFPPGSIIGILGGGQLGRMTALAAAKLGYRCHIFCTHDSEPAVEVSAFHTISAFDDSVALEKFAKSVDVVTLEWENVPLKSLETISQYVCTHPSKDVLRVAQDREQEKLFARSLGVGTTEFIVVHSLDELKTALKNFSLPAILKSTRMGYDGKGQVKILPGTSPEQAWQQMGSDVGILEAYVDFTCEISVIVAARADGVLTSYPAVKNIHREQILRETIAPADIDPVISASADACARKMTEKLGVVGLLAIEFFVLKKPDAQGHHVLMNEIAPRPHNSGHWTMDACTCSQFEQLVRAICGLPLGSTTPHSQATMYNLIGDDYNHWQEKLQCAEASLHLYGKTDIRVGRKMGHVNILRGKW